MIQMVLLDYIVFYRYYFYSIDKIESNRINKSKLIFWLFYLVRAVYFINIYVYSQRPIHGICLASLDCSFRE